VRRGGRGLLVAQPVLFSARPRTVAAVDPERLRAHVERLSQTLHPRSEQYPENLDRAAAYIRDELSAAGARVGEQTYEFAGDTFRNVIGAFGPEDGERLVVGAHYDAVAGTHGADDNASGVAGLIELARLLRAAAPPIRIDLVAWSLEEPPHFREPEMGSMQHAAGLRRDGVRVRAMISLEMIGYFTDAPRSQGFPVGLLRLIYPDAGNFIAVVGRFGDARVLRRVKASMRGATDLPVRSLCGPTFLPGVDFSDHLSYWAHGYPGLMITDTSFYRNPHYHEPTDTADRLDYARMAKVVQGVYAALMDLGGA
jgi:Zn-dependent M28 family amino/carboxypeptidase